jgi:ribosomal protein L30/L7E
MATDLEMLQLIENLVSFEISPRYQAEFQDDSYSRQGMVNKVVNLIRYGYTVRDFQISSEDPRHVKIAFFWSEVLDRGGEVLREWYSRRES